MASEKTDGRRKRRKLTAEYQRCAIPFISRRTLPAA